MSKILVYLIAVPFISLLIFKAVFISDYDLKQRYIKDQIDVVCYEVKITGVLSTTEYNNFKTKINRLSDFNRVGCIILKKGDYINGTVTNLIDYAPGTVLNKGDAFLIYVQSATVSNYSRIQNAGINPDDSQNLYYKAKAQCRVELYG